MSDYYGTDGDDVLDQSSLGLPNWSAIFGGKGNDSLSIAFGNLAGEAGDDKLIGTGSGATAVYWTSLTSILVDLQAGWAQDGFGTVDELVNIHSVHGSGAADTLLGSDADNQFSGGGGDDLIDGRGGDDTLSIFESSSSGFSVTYDPATALTTVKDINISDGNSGTKTLKNIENIQFPEKLVVVASLIPGSMIAKMTIAGTWIPVTDGLTLSKDYNGGLANTFHALIPLGVAGEYGMVVTGWGFSGWPAKLTSIAPVSMAIFSTDVNGNLEINTSNLISDAMTNGGGSVIVTDFNGDGRSDIFLAAHNESPFIAMPSVAYIANELGTFDKITLTDHVMAHDAQLAYIEGRATIVTGTFGPGDANPLYTYSDGLFQQSLQSNMATLGGMDSTLAAFGANGELEIARGDVGITWSQEEGWDVQNIVIYAFNGMDVTSMTPVQSIVPYLSTLPQYQDVVSLSGKGLTHTYRLWNDDLNHDGSPDILAGESMWSESSNDWPAALQVLINNGDGTFRDATATLNPEMSLDVSEMDYNPMFIDIDHSGIKTFLFAGSTSWGAPKRQSDFVLLNDGTGRLHIGLHDQFTELAPLVNAFLGLPFNSTSTPPRFIAIPKSDGALDFVAEVSTTTFNAAENLSQAAYTYVNVPLHFNPTTDYLQNVSILDRNGSQLIRTWAGNDLISDTNRSNFATSIDGGLGVDTAMYSGNITDYLISYNPALGSATVTDHRTNAYGADSLKHIEKLQFSDKTFELVNLPRTETPTHSKTSSFLFDAVYYLLKNPELVPTVTLSGAYEHYKTIGAATGDAPNAWFDPVYYANKWADLKPLNLDAATLFQHYNLFGVWEGRSGGPVYDKYDGVRYLTDNPDVADYVDSHLGDFLGSRSNGAIAHYVIYGANEGRLAYDTTGVALEQAILIGTPV